MKSILIVEDSKVVNNMLNQELAKLFYSCTQAFCFTQAQEYIKQNHYDLIILDLHLPDGEGYELISNVQSLTDTKVVILTGNTEKQLREELFHHGILDYIIKDKNLSYAIKEIHTILEHLSSNKDEKILVIDDSAFIRKQIQMILEPRDYKIDFAKTAQEGIDLLQQNTYDLITLDLELPDMHGLEMLSCIKSHPQLQDIPILVISGNTDPDVIRKTYKKGGNEYIRKPFIMEEFALKVDIWCDYKRQHKEALAQKDRLLSQQSKMATMGEMLENIIHQSRQPLSSITTIASGTSVEKEYDLLTPEKLDENLHAIVELSKHISDTMNSFRNFYKTDSYKTNFHLSKLLHKAFQLTSSKFKSRDIKIIENFEDINLQGYEIELLQVFINILNNARDQLEAKNISDKVVFVSTSSDTSNIYIDFKDNAGGIQDNIIDEIFESHFTTKSEDEGTGIGLYMSQQIIQQHHKGNITVSNQNFSYNDTIYKGALFRIVLPKNNTKHCTFFTIVNFDFSI